jgi:hypothetical protein
VILGSLLHRQRIDVIATNTRVAEVLLWISHGGFVFRVRAFHVALDERWRMASGERTQSRSCFLSSWKLQPNTP